MTQTLREGNLAFHFDHSVRVLHYDRSRFHASRSHSKKAVDIVCTAPSISDSFYIEIKDFRVITSPPKHSNLQEIHTTVVQKYEDTKNGLEDLRQQTQYAPDDQFATLALAATKDIIALHLEPHAHLSSYMFPKARIANITQQTNSILYQKQLSVKVICLNMATTNENQLPWTVTLLP